MAGKSRGGGFVKGHGIFRSFVKDLYLTGDLNEFHRRVIVATALGDLGEDYISYKTAHELMLLPAWKSKAEFLRLDPIERRQVLRAPSLLSRRGAEKLLGVRYVFYNPKLSIELNDAITVAAAFHTSPLCLGSKSVDNDISWYRLADPIEFTNDRLWNHGSYILDGEVVGVTHRVISGWVEVSITSDSAVFEWVGALDRVLSKLMEIRYPRIYTATTSIGSKIQQDVFVVLIPLHQPDTVYALPRLLSSKVSTIVVKTEQTEKGAMSMDTPWQAPPQLIELLRSMNIELLY